MASVHFALGNCRIQHEQFPGWQLYVSHRAELVATFLATMVGHFLAAALVVFSSYPGLFYNIPFPIATRIAWGEFGMFRKSSTPLLIENVHTRVLRLHIRRYQQNSPLRHLVRRPILARRPRDLHLSLSHVAFNRPHS